MMMIRLVYACVMLLSWAATSDAAVTLNANATAFTRTTVGATSISSTNLTIAAGTDRCLVGWLIWSGNPTNTPTMAWDAAGTPQAMTLLTSHADDSGLRVYLFGLVAPTTGNLTLTADWAGGTNGTGVLHATAFNGCNQTGGTTTFPAAPTPVKGTTGTAAITITGVAARDATVSGLAHGNDTIGANNITTSFKDNTASSSYRGAGQYDFTSSGSVQHTWAAGFVNWAIVANGSSPPVGRRPAAFPGVWPSSESDADAARHIGPGCPG